MKMLRQAALVAALAGATGLAVAQGASPAPAQTPSASPAPCATPPCGPGPGPQGGPGGHGMRQHQQRGAMFACLDTDRDGSVSRAELQAAQQRQLEGFDKADANGDGKLAADEMRAARRQWRDMNPDCRHGQGRGGPGPGPAARPGA